MVTGRLYKKIKKIARNETQDGYASAIVGLSNQYSVPPLLAEVQSRADAKQTKELKG